MYKEYCTGQLNVLAKQFLSPKDMLVQQAILGLILAQ